MLSTKGSFNRTSEEHISMLPPCFDIAYWNPLLIDWIYCEDKRTHSSTYLYLLEEALFEKVLLPVCLNKLGTHNKFIPKYRGSSIRAWNSAFPSEVNLPNFHLISPMSLLIPFAVGFAFCLVRDGCKTGSALRVPRSDFPLNTVLTFPFVSCPKSLRPALHCFWF